MKNNIALSATSKFLVFHKRWIKSFYLFVINPYPPPPPFEHSCIIPPISVPCNIAVRAWQTLFERIDGPHIYFSFPRKGGRIYICVENLLVISMMLSIGDRETHKHAGRKSVDVSKTQTSNQQATSSEIIHNEGGHRFNIFLRRVFSQMVIFRPADERARRRDR